MCACTCQRCVSLLAFARVLCVCVVVVVGECFPRWLEGKGREEVGGIGKAECFGSKLEFGRTNSIAPNSKEANTLSKTYQNMQSTKIDILDTEGL